MYFDQMQFAKIYILHQMHTTNTCVCHGMIPMRVLIVGVGIYVFSPKLYESLPMVYFYIFSHKAKSMYSKKEEKRKANESN